MFAVTSARKAGSREIAAAREWAEELNVPLIHERGAGGIKELCRKNCLDALLVSTAKGPSVFTEAGEFSYHPGMAVLRLERIKKGERDHFAEALNIRPGMKILDATLGLGHDAAIASYLAGENGSITGLEASPLLYFVVKYGLKNYNDEDRDLTAALRRIKPINIKAEDYLKGCEKDSFDAVFFDPMFRSPVKGSSDMAPLRPIAFSEPMAGAAVKLAINAAPLVVIKERSERVLQRLGCTEISGGRYSSVKFGIIRK